MIAWSRFGILPYALLMGAVFAVYANIYHNAFLYDDNLLIVHNPAIRDWGAFFSSLIAPLTHDSSYYRPLQTLLYALVFHIAGLSLLSFHLLNVGFHAANAALGYRLGQKLNFDPIASFLAALLWAVHPAQTEAVTYVSATADTLYSFFCLLGVLAIVPDYTPRRIGASTVLMLCGLFAKESACVFPLLAASCLYLRSEKRFEWKTYLCLWPLVLTGFAYVGLRFALMPPHVAGGEVTPAALSGVDYAPFAMLPTYVRIIFWPSRLHMGYDFPVYASVWRGVVLGGIGVILLALTQILYNVRNRLLPLNWGLCWFAAAYLPCFFVASPFYEHWLYLPTAGLFLGVAQSSMLYLQKLDSPKINIAAVAITLSITLVMGLLTYRQNEIWRDPVVFYNDTIEQGELAVKLHINLGAYYAELGAYEKAIAQDEIAIQNSHDTQALAQANLAAALLMLPDRKQHADEAVRHFQRALEIDPDFYPSMDALAAFYEQQGDAEKAMFYREKAKELRRKFPFLQD